MASFCGFDFGTSNSTIGIWNSNQVDMVPLDGSSKVIRSAIFIDHEDKSIYFGEKAVSHYLDGVEGRLMQSIKSVLGTSLMNEKTMIFNEMKSFSEILGYFIKELKYRAESYQGKEIDSVVLGRPVRFNDDDDKLDQKAEDTLINIAINQGFKNVEFQYEPVAAAIAFQRQKIKGEIALIVDIGGGTSDFTIIKMSSKNNHASTEILATNGIHIEGTNFDQQLAYTKVMPVLGLNSTLRAVNGSDISLPITWFRTLSTWHQINSLYNKLTVNKIINVLATANNKKLTNRLIDVLTNKYGHEILEKVEIGKKNLSTTNDTPLDLFPNAKPATADMLCSVGIGLTLDAMNKYA